MFVKKIKFVDYNDVEREDTYYFNINQAELIELEAMTPGGLENYIKKRDILHQQEEDEANGVEEITDEDLKDYKEFVEAQQQEDKEMKEFEFTDNT